MRQDSPNLDLLRSCAVGLVLLSHTPDFMDGVAWAFNYKTMGRLGVALFFVHTTLVLLLSMDRHGPAPLQFFVRRAFRIYPLSIAAVLLMATALFIGGHPLGWAEIASNLLLVQNLTGHRSWPQPLWTLPFEIQMYLLLPALYVVATSARPLLRVAGIYLAALALAALLWPLSTPELLVGFAPCFLVGAMAYVIGGRAAPRVGPWLLFATIVASSLVVPSLAATEAQELPLFWAACLVIGLLIPASREIRWRPLVLAAHTIAKYSYGIYLTHIFAMGLALMGTDAWYIRVVTFVFVQAVLAVLAYRLIEAPGIRLGKRIAARWPRVEAARIAGQGE
jgi:peptidoglycan/LPS O-acetylase OafA/YrhL